MFGIANSTPGNVLVQGIFQHKLRETAGKYLSGRLLDIGCGSKPYEKLLSNYVTEHIGVDHCDTLHDKSRTDLTGTAYAIPMGGSEFDSVICTAVLEHLEEPERALVECLRVLKPGGYAFYSVPFIWHIHEEPRDFFRYSRYGLEYIFKKVGFEIIEIEALSGFWVTFGQLLVYNMHRANRGPLRWLKVIDFAGLLVQGTAFCLDRLDKTERWTWMYTVVARKPFSPEAGG
jgi:SAM-dependent methyltransferase